ncbi:hypothetical protein HDV05_001070, partial [Chytridiales sp. JEL 0842]
MLNKSIRRYFWDSKSAKANHLIETFGLEQSIVESVRSNCYIINGYVDVLEYITRRYSGCLCEEEGEWPSNQCPIYKITFDKRIPPAYKAQLVTLINFTFSCEDSEHYIPSVEEAVRQGNLELLFGLLRIRAEELVGLCDDAKRQLVDAKVMLED